MVSQSATLRRSRGYRGVSATLRGTVVAAGLGLGLMTLAADGPVPGTSAAVSKPLSARSQAVRPAGGPAWSELPAAQRAALGPLEREWAELDTERRQKWIEIAERLPRLSPAERERVAERMTAWVKMSPQERAQVRLHFQEAKQVAPQNRKESWDAYQALSPEERRQLAARAAFAPVTADPKRRGDRPEPAAAARDGAQVKSNIVTNPTFTAMPRAVSPTVVQMRPGATTSLISRRPTPPAHEQTGLPKINASPGFVDRTTLLPQRGAQGAAMSVVPPAEYSAPPAPVAPVTAPVPPPAAPAREIDERR